MWQRYAKRRARSTRTDEVGGHGTHNMICGLQLAYDNSDSGIPLIANVPYPAAHSRFGPLV